MEITVALVICKLKRILKGFTSLAAQRVFFDDANNATCKSRVGLYSVTFPCCPSQSGLLSASPVNVQEAHEYKRAIQLCSTDFYCTVVTSSRCVLHRRLAINMSLFLDAGSIRGTCVNVLYSGLNIKGLSRKRWFVFKRLTLL